MVEIGVEPSNIVKHLCSPRLDQLYLNLNYLQDTGRPILTYAGMGKPTAQHYIQCRLGGS